MLNEFMFVAIGKDIKLVSRSNVRRLQKKKKPIISATERKERVKN